MMKNLTLYLFVLMLFISCKKNDEEITPQTTEELTFNGFDTLLIPSKFKQNVMFNGFTATWCGWCPALDHDIELNTAHSPKRIFGVIVHSDDLHTTQGDSLLSFFNVIGFPDWGFNYTGLGSSSYDYYLTFNQNYGIAIDSKIVGNSIKLNVMVGFSDNVNAQLKLAVYLIEDSLFGPGLGQVNSYNNDTSSYFYGLGAFIADYHHNMVLRQVISASVFGDNIPLNFNQKGSKYLKSYYFKIPASYNKNNLKIIAFVTDGYITSSTTTFQFNVNGGKLGSTSTWNY